MRHAARHADLLAGAAVGLIAGLGAAFVMEAFQNKVSELRKKAEAAKPDGEQGGSGQDQSEPSTEKAADKLSKAATGVSLPAAYKPSAGRAVHYATGAALGTVYGAVAERWRGVTAGSGLGFSAATALLVDNGMVPLLGLSAPPQNTSPQDHLYSLASHGVYGLTLEILRKTLRQLV